MCAISKTRMKSPSSPSPPPVMQQSLSIYTLVGALQCALVFFALPPLCKPLWPQIFNGLSPEISDVVLWSIALPYYVIYILFVALPPYLLGWEFFEQYKISKNPWPWKDEREKVRKEFWRLAYKSLFIDFVNICVGIPICVYAKATLFPQRAASFSTEDWPTQWELFYGVISIVIMHELGFYATHRLMHAYPTLYQYHKVHHEYKQNNVLSSQHFHPVDFVFSIALPTLLTTGTLRSHSFTQSLAGLWILSANFDDHLGYAFPWSPVRWFPFSAGTDAHEFHHSVNMGCYGSKLSIWDSVFQTDKVYKQWREKREAKVQD